MANESDNPLIVRNCIFENCGHGTNGGSSSVPVFACDGSGKVEIERCLVYNSSRIIDNMLNNRKITIRNCTFANISTDWGGITSNVKEITNTIMYKANQNSCSGTAPDISYSLFSGYNGAWGGPISGQLHTKGNMDRDPLFVDPANGDYRLQEGSPCIDAGDPNSPKDPDGTVADIGFYYYSQGAEVIESKSMQSTMGNEITYALQRNTLQIFANSTRAIDVAICDVRGRVLSSYLLIGSSKHNIDLSYLSCGVYCLIAKSDTYTMVKSLQVVE